MASLPVRGSKYEAFWSLCRPLSTVCYIQLRVFFCCILWFSRLLYSFIAFARYGCIFVPGNEYYIYRLGPGSKISERIIQMLLVQLDPCGTRTGRSVNFETWILFMCSTAELLGIFCLISPLILSAYYTSIDEDCFTLMSMSLLYCIWYEIMSNWMNKICGLAVSSQVVYLKIRLLVWLKKHEVQGPWRAAWPFVRWNQHSFMDTKL